MKFKGGLAISVLVATAGLAGCGGGATPNDGGTTTRAAASNIAGNWLLAGSLPAGPGARKTSTQLAVTFATSGDQLLAAGQAEVICPGASNGSVISSGAIGFGFVATGQVLADGDYTVQSQTTTGNGTALPSVNISGHLPATPGGAWTGSYAIDTRLAEATCPVAVGGATSATVIAPVTGTYKATGAYVVGTTKTPITVTMTLQQGVTTTAAGSTVDQAYALNGTVAVEGTSCFHTGTLRTAVATATGLAGVGGSVFGTEAFPDFVMDDGSSVLIPVYIADTGSTQLDAEGLGVSSGSCASSLTQQIQIGNFVRQP